MSLAFTSQTLPTGRDSMSPDSISAIVGAASADSISPIAKIDRIKTPLFVIHGKNDPRVPYTEAEQVVEALRQRKAVVEYKLFDDEGHGISKLKNRLELYPLVADFLDKYMK